MPSSNCEKLSQFCDDLGSNILYSAGPVLTLNGPNTASDYVDILDSQVHRVVQVFFLTMMQFFKMTICPYTQPEVFSLGGAWCTSTSSLASTITQLKYHQTTVVSFRKQGEKQIPSISQTTTRRVVLYSTRDYSELTWVYFKKDTSCITGILIKNSILINKCVSFTAVSIIFVHPLYMLPSYIPWGD